MKKLMLVGLLFVAGYAGASCVGPYCWDDTGMTMGGYQLNGNGHGLPVLSSTTITGLTSTIGTEIICNSCVNAGTNRYGLCIATSAANTGFVMVSSSTLVCK